MKINKTSLKKLLTRKRFQAYLDSQDYRKMAGVCGSSSKCAISAYIWNTLKLDEKLHTMATDELTVEIDVFKATGEYVDDFYIDTPTWAVMFIQEFDEGPNVTRKSFKTAANILRSI